MLVQRVVMPSSPLESWTVLGDDAAPVEPIERYLAYLTDIERSPNTELLSTVKFMAQTVAAAGELQRDLQRELTYDGLRAAEAKGNKGGRRPAVTTGKTDAVRAAYRDGQSIAALARDHGVSRREPSAPPSPTSSPSTPSPATAPPQPQNCRSRWIRRARSPTSSTPPKWNPSSGPYSTKASPYAAARATPCA